nr:MAG TPA: hypothetical protein [Caudoviricetes sp.]
MFHNITPVTYGLPVSKMLTTSSGVTTGNGTRQSGIFFNRL